MSKSFMVVVFCLIPLVVIGANTELHSFKKMQLTDQFWAEGANFGDFNNDGKKDIVCGPFWYEAPSFKKRHEYYPANERFKVKHSDGTEETVSGFEGALGSNNTYSKNFVAYVYDFNRDGWLDILIVGFPGEETSWYENPKKSEGHWSRHIVFQPTDNESPIFADLTGDGKPELICNSAGYFGYAEPSWKSPQEPWKFHAISPKGSWQRFTHGIGIGDVSGDGKNDLLERDGWWEQPDSLAGDPVWQHHEVPFAPGVGSAQMYAYDVNGDGLNDVITCLNAHGYGLAWYEQLQNKNEKGEPAFKQHLILNPNSTPNKYGVSFSQLHSLDLIDIDGDGLKDLVTGKRFWAHGKNGPDPESNSAAVLYWFKLVRNKDKTADFIPYMIDDDSGIGTQAVAGDINSDKLPDIVVGNKKGTFVFIQEKKKVSQAEWEKSQPKAISASNSHEKK